MTKLTIDILEKIPEENWINFIKSKYNHDCDGVSYFLIGEESDNGFLTFKTFCDELNQTFCDVTEDEFLLIQSNSYPSNKYVDEEKDLIRDTLLEAVWIMRWSENKEALYAVLEPEEAMKIVDDIFIELDKIGYQIKKK